ncbi:hypothetical protein SLEP1_g47561 [Rubroshorea leprosula]|uniref:Uncharacterized protein n=1 Tax=Rubroshorea leprosula TaxID=152421 RepID=A0AAV5LRS3_9ROSI|nr:hypothetical protein SLEP1_g47561 [Rubroshorea leprosula]
MGGTLEMGLQWLLWENVSEVKKAVMLQLHCSQPQKFREKEHGGGEEAQGKTSVVCGGM